jgi:hypothetical protein
MAEKKPNNAGPGDSDLDRTLDGVLAKYAAVEPRAGLEGRILANLRAERGDVPERSWWSWGLAAAVAAVFVVAIAIALRPEKPSKPTIADDHQVPAQTVHEPEQRLASDHHGVVKDSLKPRHKRQDAPHSWETRVAVRTPRLNQFPSPQPLSEEELALARYVRDFPQEAVLVAQSQKESEVEMQKKMGKTEPTSAEQQER